MVAAFAVLFGFGAVWFSVRNQYPFRGPTTGALIVLFVLLAIRIATVLFAHHRARSGVSGRSVRLGQAEVAAVVVSLVAAYLLMIGLATHGNKDASFFWVYALSATLIVLGAVWAMRSAIREDWNDFATSVAVMFVAAVGSLFGPRGMWLVDGIGLFAILLWTAVTRAQMNRSADTP